MNEIDSALYLEYSIYLSIYMCMGLPRPISKKLTSIL